MSATSRELVSQSLEFRGPARAPRNMWPLPWVETQYPGAVDRIYEEFPDDIAWCPDCLDEPAITQGDAYAVGRYVDPWGVVFENVHAGIGGQVVDPIVEDWRTALGRIRFPREWLTVNADTVNRFCAGTDKFVFAGCLHRPFERMQFLRGTEELMIDIMLGSPEMHAFLGQYHSFICDVAEIWAKTDVDCLFMMDDWGSQQSMLIAPDLWRTCFKPLYRDYVDIAHSHGKKVLMHSDGNILDIYPDLVEIGVDALNSQIFCIGLDKVAEFAGQLTFWGEIDRQHILCAQESADVDRAVQNVYNLLWRNGGCVAQCEFGPAAKPENVRQVFATWDAIFRHEETDSGA